MLDGTDGRVCVDGYFNLFNLNVTKCLTSMGYETWHPPDPTPPKVYARMVNVINKYMYKDYS